jgi:hypothetical protein
MANLSVSGTAATANDAFLAKPFWSTSASLSFSFAAFTFATAIAFAFSSFACTSLEVGAKEASTSF